MIATPKTLFRGAATTNTATTLYTVPASTTAVVTNISITNTAASAGTFTMGFAGTNFATTVSVAASDTVMIDTRHVLDATQVITGGASANTINFHISGVEIA